MARHFIKFILTISFFGIYSQPCLANKTIKVAVGESVPPWVIQKNNSGIVVDILKTSLEPQGYKVDIVHVPLARRILEYKSGNVQAVCDINQDYIREYQLKGHFSGIVYSYQNVGISLKKKKFKFSSIADLTSHSVVAWQGAKDVLGKEYTTMVNKNKNYREIANQRSQILLLYSEREDVIQIDKQIFKYYRKLVKEDGVDTSAKVDIFPLFGENKCGYLFTDKEVQKAFIKGFNDLKKSGKFEDIFHKYGD